MRINQKKENRKYILITIIIAYTFVCASCGNKKFILETDKKKSYITGNCSYESWLDFSEKYDLPYASEEIFETIKAAYKEVDFLGEFREGDLETYEEYKRIFFELLQGTIPVVNRQTNEEKYMGEYEIFWGEYNPNHNSYYFFDADGDGFPELGVEYNTRRYIFKYDFKEEEIILWYPNERDICIGTGKVQWHGNDQYFGFYQLNEDGEKVCSTFLFSSWYSAETSLYMAMLPKYADANKEVDITEEMKMTGVYAQMSEQWFFRITEEQYEELMVPYWEAYFQAQEEIKKVTYTYEELFGSLTPSQ